MTLCAPCHKVFEFEEFKPLKWRKWRYCMQWHMVANLPVGFAAGVMASDVLAIDAETLIATPHTGSRGSGKDNDAKFFLAVLVPVAQQTRMGLFRRRQPAPLAFAAKPREVETQLRLVRRLPVTGHSAFSISVRRSPHASGHALNSGSPSSSEIDARKSAISGSFPRLARSRLPRCMGSLSEASEAS